MSRQNYLRGSPPAGRNQDDAKKPSMNDLLNDLEDFTSDFRGGKYNNGQNNLRPPNVGGGISPSSPSVTGIAPPRGTSLSTRRGGGGDDRQAVTLDRARLGRNPSNPNMRQNEFDNPMPLTTMTIDRGGGGPFRRDYDGPPLGSPNIGQNTISRARSRSRGRPDDEPPPPLPNSNINTTPLRQPTRPDQQNTTPLQPPNFSPYSRNRPNGDSPNTTGGGSPIPFPRPRQGSNAGLEDRGKMFETDDSGSDSGGGRSRNGTANKDELANALQRGRMRAEAAMVERSESGGTATLRRPSFGRAGTLERGGGGGGRRDPPPPQGSPPAANDNPSSPPLNSADGGGGERSGRNMLKAAAAGSNSSKDSSLTSPTLTNTSGTINLSEHVHAIFGGSSNSVAAAVAFGNAFNLSRKDTNNTASPSSATAIADDMLIQLAVQEALLDTKRFPVLPETRYESYKKDLSELNKSMASLHTRLTTENRIREAALSLAKMNAGGGKEQARNAQEQLANASKKVDAVATELWKTAGRVMEIERHVLKHLAAVLRYEALRLGENGVGETVGGGGGEMKTKLSSAETKIKEQETMIAALKSTVTRLEGENEEMNKELPDLRSDKEILERKLKRLERMVKESDEEIKRLRSSKEASDNESERKPDPRGQEVARLKLEVERWKAENEKSQLENHVAQDQIAELRLQLEEDQLMVESKDRNISNLMSEIEMLQTKVDMYAAKDSRTSAAERERNMGSIRSQITSQLNEQNTKRKSVFGGQLKDAVMEREKLKTELREEKSKVRDLQLKVLELEAAGMGGEEVDVKENAGYTVKMTEAKKQISELEDKLKETQKDTQTLKKLFISIVPSSNAQPTSPRSPGTIRSFANLASNDEWSASVEKYSAEALATHANNMVAERDKLIRRLKEVEETLDKHLRETNDRGERERSDARSREDNLSRQVKQLESEVTKLTTQLDDSKRRARIAEQKEAERASENSRTELQIEKLRNEVDLLRSRSSEQEMLRSTESSRRENEMRAWHERELENLRASLESEMRIVDKQRRELEAQLARESARVKMISEKLTMAEEERERLGKEREELLDQYASAEREHKEKMSRLNEDHREEMEELMVRQEREVEGALENLQREIAMKELDFEASLLAQQVTMDKKHAQEVERLKVQSVEELSKALENAAKERRKMQNETEAMYRKRQEDLENGHREEVEALKALQTSELGRIREAQNADKQRELSRMKSEHEAAIAALQADMQRALTSAAGKHHEEISQMKEQYENELRSMQESHDQEQAELIGRLNRSEAALVAYKSQHFQDRERLQESIDELEEQVRAYKQKEVDQFNNSSGKMREYENTINKMRFDMQALNAQLEDAKGEMASKDRDRAASEQRVAAQMEQERTTWRDRVEALERQLAEYEGVRSELETVERDYIQQLARKDNELRAAEAAVREVREGEELLRAQLGAVKQQLDNARRELETAKEERRAEEGRQVQASMVSEVERLQMQVVQLKTQKVEMLEELDNQHHREQAMSAELNAMRKEYDRVTRGMSNFDSERRKLDMTIAAQKQEIAKLQSRVQDSGFERLFSSSPPSGSAGPLSSSSTGEDPSMAGTGSQQKLRAEFRKMLADVRSEYTAQIDKEVSTRQQLESELRKWKKDREMESYRRLDSGTQTHLKWVESEQPMRIHGW